jgi:exopolysaccharide biosynthesis polyprenyl glycosylphosphotransferase
MKNFGRREPLILLAGDLFFFLVSLWLTLLLRYIEVPSKELFEQHLLPFGIIFLVWVVIFYIAGLYERHTILLQSRLPPILLNAQLTNSALAVIFFYLIPFFGITPKVTLFLDLIITFFAVLSWRMYGYQYLRSREPEKAILIGSGEEMKELLSEVNGNPLHSLTFVTSVDLDKTGNESFWDEIVEKIYAEDISLVVIDLTHARVAPILPHLYNLIFSRVRFIDMHKIYEDIFDRVPLSLLRYSWFLENISTQPETMYDVLKRMMDIVLSLVLLLVSIPFDLFAYVAIKLDDKGPAFISQIRMGKNNKVVKIYKFRTMTGNDEGHYVQGGKTELKVTRVGALLRKTRIDELPQIWNVLMGDLSLVGPRPELPSLMKVYEEEIPYYNVRHIIKPGLSGWAQIYQETHPHHGEAIMETKEKLAYDLYYIKNRSFLLDIKIALRTIKTLLSRVGK